LLALIANTFRINVGRDLGLNVSNEISKYLLGGLATILKAIFTFRWKWLNVWLTG
jgi:hypothetical protein